MIALLCFFLTLFASPLKSKSRLEAENAALRHQLIVLQRKVRGRVPFTNSDRLFGQTPSRARLTFVDRSTTNDACSSTPRTHQGICSPPKGRIHEVRSYCSFLSCRSECLLACCPAELGSIDPHAMQDHSELVGECDLGEFGAPPFAKNGEGGKLWQSAKPAVIAVQRKVSCTSSAAIWSAVLSAAIN
jgi:hypothetical protein